MGKSIALKIANAIDRDAAGRRFASCLAWLFVLQLGCHNEPATRVAEEAIPPAKSEAATDEKSNSSHEIDTAPRSAADLAVDSKLSVDAAKSRSLHPEGHPPNVLDDQHEVVENYDDGSIHRRWFVRLYVNFDRSRPWHQQAPGSWVEHGPFEECYPDGKQVLVRGAYAEGKRDGHWTFWRVNGQKMKEGSYSKAKLQGPWRYYRDDGTLLRIENYQAHRKHGVWTYFDVDGQTVLREEQYANDELVSQAVEIEAKSG